MSSFFSDTKPHYVTLDALRGVAALIVLGYHVFECFDWSPLPHGYLAVDFFFILSGFVIGYAYDDRFRTGKLNIKGFFRRRLIRLHPMVVLGSLIGAVSFLLQGSVRWNGETVSLPWVVLAFIMGAMMLPLWPGAKGDVRGNSEIFPLNGPSWSLFFEYIGNVAYALLLRRLPTKALALLCALSGGLLIYISLREGGLGVGWTLAGSGFIDGLVRMVFPYTVGMLLARANARQQTPTHLELNIRRYAFPLCSIAIVLIALIPSTGGLFDALCVIILFPLLVWAGATPDASSTALPRFLGDLSYPLYAVHYPFMYLFYAIIGFNGELVSINVLNQTWPQALLLAGAALLTAYLAMRFYDLPIRRLLARKK